MRVKHDLRHEMAVVTAQSHALWSALLALPETEEGMQEALDALRREERQQMAEYCGTLAQRCYQIRERCLWLKQQLQR